MNNPILFSVFAFDFEPTGEVDLTKIQLLIRTDKAEVKRLYEELGKLLEVEG